MVTEGDAEGVADRKVFITVHIFCTDYDPVIRSISNNPNPGDMTATALVRYQDPLNSNKTGLHLAVEHKQYQML